MDEEICGNDEFDRWSGVESGRLEDEINNLKNIPNMRIIEICQNPTPMKVWFFHSEELVMEFDLP
jgi:hypothetical protein